MKNILKLLLLAFIITIVSCKENEASTETNAENSPEKEDPNLAKERINVSNFKTYTGAELNEWLPNKILDYEKSRAR